MPRRPADSAPAATPVAPGAGSSASVAVRFDGVFREYPHKTGQVSALDGVSLDVPRGSIFGVIGHSGAGKSTLVRMVNGLDRPTGGRVLLEGTDLASLPPAGLRAAQKTTGMIFQQFQLLETVSVRDNVARPLILDGVRRRDARARADEVLEFVGLADKGDRRPGELSGGQKQRVGIARAIVRNPQVLLCDEATSALDPSTTTQIIELLRRINATYGTTIFVVTHEMDVIKDLCHEVAVMSDGRIVEHGTVLDVFVRPQTEIAEAFVGTVVPHTIPARVLKHVGDGDLWRLRLIDDEVTSPLVSTLITEYGVAVNILHADMAEIQQHTVGHMIIRVDGPADRVAAAWTWLESNVASIEKVTTP
ncbi:methionine ABC transporter ATP-binding protein [Amnibacterium flavum]|uniref:Methionine ABC transporter ATP-binding protein n=1 Tax=Amnibacterium flavum TaxID=2173173 RepID=A0A2V1HNU4_9MICO|nr:methionine ABC transporter ATP-binding protein [Amnibacterium flavum]PVZ94185.1 methionine ABC transporter ATP-binding protein [Amnibacterium flavum]